MTNDRDLNKCKECYLNIIDKFSKKNEELKSQIEQLSYDNHVLKTAFIDQQNQIEKMKCCENCNNHKKGKCTEDKMFYARTLKECSEWELAE